MKLSLSLLRDVLKAVVAVACLVMLASFQRSREPELAPQCARAGTLEVAPQPKTDPLLDIIELELTPRLVGAGPGEPHQVAKAIVEEAKRSGFDPWFVVAVIEVESDYHVEACSPAGALGLMQLMPATFKEVSTHYRVTDPVENVRAGIAYLSKLYGSGFKRPETILRAYNGGPALAIAYGKALRAKADVAGFPEEMVEYPGKVLARYRRLVHAAGGDHKHLEKTWRR